MTKKQMIVLFALMVFTSFIVSATTIIGGVWYLKHTSQNTSEFWSQSPLSFLSQEKTTVIPPTFHELDKVVLSVKVKRQPHFFMLEIAIETRRPARIHTIYHFIPLLLPPPPRTDKAIHRGPLAGPKKGGSNFFYTTLGGVKFFSRVLTRHARRARVTENALYRRLISILMPYKAIEVLYILL